MTSAQLQDLIPGADGVSKRGQVFTVRQGYFYRHGRSEETLAAAVKAYVPQATILASGDHFAAFRGGAPLAKSSHFWVTFTLPAERQVEAYGNKGFKNTPWRKTFKSASALHAWAEKHDATVLGTRELEANEERAS